MWRTGSAPTLLVGMQTGAATRESPVEVPQKLNTELPYDPASLGAQVVKNPPAMRETSVRSLGREDPLEEGMATHYTILAWIIPQTEELGGLQSTESKKSQTQLSD